jgi:hypothetical protein
MIEAWIFSDEDDERLRHGVILEIEASWLFVRRVWANYCDWSGFGVGLPF